jgi:hypothetical protein
VHELPLVHRARGERGANANEAQVGLTTSVAECNIIVTIYQQ